MEYGGINAKVKGMKARLLTGEDYYSLCSQANIHAAGLKLKAHEEYADIVDRLIAMKADNRQAYEQALFSVMDQNFMKIYGFVSDYHIKKYLNAWFLKREIQVIKSMLSDYFDYRQRQAPPVLQEGFHFFHMDAVALARAESLGEFLSVLAENPLFQSLRDKDRTGRSLFELELSLDFIYYRNLWRSKNKFLKGDNRKVAAMTDGAEMDLQNILWICRLKSYYNLADEQAYQYIIPIHYMLRPEHITRLVESRDMAQVRSVLMDTVYGGIFSTSGRLEEAYYSSMNRVYRSAIGRYPNSIAVTMDYLFKKSIEIKDIISVFEGVGYHMAPEKIMERIYTSVNGEVS